MDFFRIMEIMLYVLVDLFPNLILAVAPFRDSLRFSEKTTVAAAIALYIFMVLSRIVALRGLSTAAFLSILWIALYLGYYVIFIKAELAKLLFVLLTILNYGSFTTIVFNYFTCRIFPQAAERPYSLYISAALIIDYLISYPFVYRMLGRKLRSLIAFPENSRYWRFLWLVPATFCLSYYYSMYASGGVMSFSVSRSNMLFAVFFNLGALFVTYLVMHLLEESNASMRLKAENYQLGMQSVRYENLKKRMDDARRAKHDLRQTLAVIQAYVQQDDKEALLSYMQSYITSLPPDLPISYCENQAVNALIAYYGELAGENNISFEVWVEYPEKIAIADADAVVLIGNLLENALEACQRKEKGKGFIVLRIQPVQGRLIIVMDNSCSGLVQKKGGTFISAKTGQEGIGLSSVRRIADKYHGVLTLACEEEVFHVSVGLEGGGSAEK